MNYNNPFTQGKFNRGNALFPPAIQWLLLLNLGLFLLPLVLPFNPDFLNQIFGLVPAYIWTKFYLWQFVTYLFLHGGFWHILMNMFILWMFGSELERTWGSREFLRFYFITGIGAGIFNVLVAAFFQSTAFIPIIGASGAIYGILVAYAVLFPDRYVYVYFLIPVKVKYLIAFLIGLEFLATYRPTDGVAHFAHLGGALVGFLYLKIDWRWKFSKWSPTRVYQNLQDKANAKKQIEEIKIMGEVDQILDKINVVGYDNLTKREKRILEKASDSLSKHERR